MSKSQELFDLVESELAKLRQIETDLKALGLTRARPDLEQALKLIAGQIAVEEINQDYAKQVQTAAQEWKEDRRKKAEEIAAEMNLNFPYRPEQDSM